MLIIPAYFATFIHETPAFLSHPNLPPSARRVQSSYTILSPFLCPRSLLSAVTRTSLSTIMSLSSFITPSRLAGVPAMAEYVGVIFFKGQASLSLSCGFPMSPLNAVLKSMVASLLFSSLPKPLLMTLEGCATQLSLLLKSVIRLEFEGVWEGVERLGFFHCIQRRGATTGRELHMRAQTTMAAERMRNIATPSMYGGKC